MIGSQHIRAASFLARRIAPVVCAAALMVTPSGTGSAESVDYAGAPISLELVDADLQQVLTVFSQATDLVFAVDAQTVEMGGLDHLVTVDYEEIPWDQVLDEILIASGLTWTLEGKVLWIHLPAYRPDGDRNFTGDPIKLRLEDADIRDVLLKFAKITSLEIDLEPEVQGSVSLNLRDVPWDQSLDFIFRIHGLDSTQSGDSLSVFGICGGKGMQFLP
jgi:type II secretory pathway component HofQ